MRRRTKKSSLSSRLPQRTKEICGSSLRFEKERLVSCPRFQKSVPLVREREREREKDFSIGTRILL